VAADLDGDERLELVLGGWDGRVYAWRADGSLQPGWPVETENPDKTVPPGFVYARDFKVATTPTLVDVDGDGLDDVVVALQDTSFPAASSAGPVTGYLTAFSGLGNAREGGATLTGYPMRIPALVQGYGTAQDFVTEGVQTPAAFETPTGPQLVANAGLAQANVVDLRRAQVRPLAPAIVPADGPLQPATPMVHFTTSASLGRLLPGSPTPQAAQGGTATSDVALAVAATPGLGVKVRHGLTAYDPVAGAPLPGFATARRLGAWPVFAAPAIADVSGDGRPDLVINTDSASVEAFDGLTGAPVPGWPKWSGGWALWTPAVGDLDGDGTVEVVVTTREGYVHAWRTPGLAQANTEAWHYHQDDRNTGRYGRDTRPPGGVPDLQVRTEGADDVLTFTAPGDDWSVGTATSYELFRSATPLTQDRLAGAEQVPVQTQAVPAGERVELRVPRVAGRSSYAVRGGGRRRQPGAGAPGGRRPGRARRRRTRRCRTWQPVAAPRPAAGRLAATGAEAVPALAGALLLLVVAGARRRRA
jgi:hypothetical protein